MLARLTDEEAALYSILTDPAGIDLAEAFFMDEERPDRCWRAHPYQWAWWRCRDSRQIDQAARDLGKTLGVALRTCTWPFRRPGQQRAIVAPELNHLNLVTTPTEHWLFKSWLLKSMMRPGRQAVTHRPFEVVFLNGSTVVGRIPQRDGKAVKGLHAVELEIDESQDVTEDAWKEVIDTVKRSAPGFKWLIHGVTRGSAGTFFRYTLPNSGFRVHRFVGMHRPSWTDQEREQKIEEYGGYDTPDYRRNVLGLHGDASSVIFPLYALTQITDQQAGLQDDEPSDYNANVYRRIIIPGEEVSEVSPIEGFLDVPFNHLSGYQNYWAGMDIGITIAPSEILIFGEEPLPKSKVNRLKLLLRVSLQRVLAPDQADVIRWLVDTYPVKVFAMDAGGMGLPMIQDLQRRQQDPVARKALEVIKGYNFSSKVPVELKEAYIDEDGYPVEEELLEKNAKDAGTDYLRMLVDKRRIWLPFDRDLIGQFQGQTMTVLKSGTDEYGRRRSYSGGNDHALDAARFVALAYCGWELEEYIRIRSREPKQEEVFFSIG